MHQWLRKIEHKMKSDLILKRVSVALSMSFLGAVVSRICLLLLNMFLSRILGKEDFGRYSLVNSTIQTFVTFASLGLGASLLRYTSLYHDTDKKRCGQLIGTFSVICCAADILIAAALFFLSNPISLWVDSSQELSSLFKIGSIIVLFIALYSVCQNILLGFEAYGKVTVNEIAYGAICLAITLFFARFFSLVGAVIGMLLSRIIGTAIMSKTAFSKCRNEKIPCFVRFDREITSSFESFVLPTFLSSILVLPINWCLNMLLAKNAGYEELAAYAVSYQWVTMIAYAMSLFTRVKPIYTDLFAHHNFGEFRKLLRKMIWVSSFIGTSIAIIGAVGSKWIMSFYGSDYVKYWLVFFIMMCASIAMTLQSQFGAVLEAIGKMWVGFILNAVWSVNLLVIFYFLSKYGALGCSIAFFTSYLLHCGYCWCITNMIIRRKMNEAL